jgi:hypothetical protein
VAAFVIGLIMFWALRVAVKRRRRRGLPAQAVIVSPRRSTAIAQDGAVRSVQSAELTLSQEDLERLWTPKNLENLARTYWRFLQRVTLGLIRVHYGEDDRSVVLLVKPLTLLRFELPEYEMDENHGSVRWQIRDGLLVARPGRDKGGLALKVTRDPDDVVQDRTTIRIEVSVTNFYPSIASGFSTPVYKMTQSVLHVLVGHAFLRSLATLHLAHSKVGKLSSSDAVQELASGAPPEPDQAEQQDQP